MKWPTFCPADSDEALRHLMKFLHSEFNTVNVSWFAAIHLPDAQVSSATQGWRQRAFGYLFPTQELSARVDVATRRTEVNQVDITTVRNIALAGSWRTNRLIDLADADWFK